MPARQIRSDLPPEELRRLAKMEADARVTRRLLALANALDGMSRAEAARSAGMDRQTLRDWVVRYNDGGVAALADDWGDGRPCRLDEGQQAVLKAIVLRGGGPREGRDLGLACERSVSDRGGPLRGALCGERPDATAACARPVLADAASSAPEGQPHGAGGI